MSMLVKALGWLGVGLLLTSGLSYMRSRQEERLDLQPLTLSLSLAPGSVRTSEFKTDFDYWDYEIDIDFKPRFDRVPVVERILAAKREQPLKGYGENPMDQAIGCLLGSEPGTTHCDGPPKILDVTWTLFEGRQAIAHGGSDHNASMQRETGVAVSRQVGLFRGQRGHSYELELSVNRDGSELNVLDPKLVVRVPRGYWDDHAMAIAFYRLIAAVLALTGLALLVLAASRAWRRDRAAPS